MYILGIEKVGDYHKSVAALINVASFIPSDEMNQEWKYYPARKAKQVIDSLCHSEVDFVEFTNAGQVPIWVLDELETAGMGFYFLNSKMRTG